MSSSETIIQGIKRYNTALLKSLTLWEGTVKTAINESEKELNSKKDQISNINFEIITKPYFNAFYIDMNRFSLIPFDFLSFIFQVSSPEFLPDEAVVSKTAKILLKISEARDDEPKIRACRLVSNLLLSASGRKFAHGKILYDLFKSVIIIFNSAKPSQKTVSEVSEMTVHETMRTVIGMYDNVVKFPDFNTVEDLSKHVIETIKNDAFTAIEIMPNYPQYANMHDVDVTIILSILTDSLEKRIYSEKTNILLLSTLDGLLNSTFSFFSKPFFFTILNRDIKIAVIAATIDGSLTTTVLTAQLIVTIWSRFSYYFSEGLNEILDSGLSVQLNQTTPSLLQRAFGIFNELAKYPTLLIDTFVNYDCDQSGYFKNFFQNSMNVLIKYAYPSQSSEHSTKSPKKSDINPKTQQNLQISALATLVTVLENLWNYHMNAQQAENKGNNKEAEDIVAQKEIKNLFDRGVQIFKNSAKKGVQFFIDNKIIEDTPKSIADFLYDTPQLDMANVGEYIGGSQQKNKDTLVEYVSRFSFKGLGFEEAFRLFLKKFMIPGEGQMIDRIMEQFGTKYYQENPEHFSCADTVYVLAYSALMLHTDAHNKAIKNHMTLPEFIANNRGIDNGHDLDEAFLTELYKGITKEQIFVLATPSASSGSNMNAMLTQEQRIELYNKQCKHTLQQARAHTDQQRKVFKHCSSPILLGPMLNSIWGPLIAAVSISLETSNIPEITDYCIRLLSASLHIASHCYVKEALEHTIDAFITFTRMRYETDIQKPKNIQCAKAFLRCVIDDRNYLKGTWAQFLSDISAMEKLKEKPKISEYFQKAEELYQATETLDKESIVDFTKAQCDISLREINEKPPRYYMLQCLGAVADFNMNRPKIIWNDIWNIISPTLVKAGLSEDFATSSFTVDLLRQLAQKFLSKPEIAEFHFQQRFLQPFYDIFQGNSSIEVRELILEMLLRIVQRNHSTLHSGWTIIINVATEASKNTDTIRKGLTILETMIFEYPEDYQTYIIDCLRSLATFLVNDKTKQKQIAIQAITLFAAISSHLKEQEQWITAIDALADATDKLTADDNELISYSTESAVDIIQKYGCENKYFNDDTFNTIFSTSVPRLILGSKNQEMEKKLVDSFFKTIFSYTDLITPTNIAKFVISICHNTDIRETVLTHLRTYMEPLESPEQSIKEEIQNDQEISDIADELISIFKL